MIAMFHKCPYLIEIRKSLNNFISNRPLLT